MLTADGRAGSSQSCRRPESSASGQQSSGHAGQFRPSLLASSYGTEAAYTESFDDVQEMEEALDRYVNFFKTTAISVFIVLYPIGASEQGAHLRAYPHLLSNGNLF